MSSSALRCYRSWYKRAAASERAVAVEQAHAGILVLLQPDSKVTSASLQRQSPCPPGQSLQHLRPFLVRAAAFGV